MTDDQWLSESFERNYALLYRIGRVILGTDPTWENMIEDQIQETYVRAWQKRSLLKKHPNPDGWAVECFRKCLANACRKQYREWKNRAFPEQPEEYSDETAIPETNAVLKEKSELLCQLLGEEDARLFLRYCVDGEKASEIASELRVSEQAFRMRICRIRKKILKNREIFTCLVFLCLCALQ